MPNWCSNYIELIGEPKDISRVSTILKVREDDHFFSSLLGSNNHKDTWYDDNITQLGTKWDVSVSTEELNLDNDGIEFHCESAWSPPVAGLVSVCQRYNLQCIISYEEPGGDFYGRTKIDSNGILEEEDYEYREGKYRLDPDHFWESLEFDIECDVEELSDTYSIDDLISETYNFLDEEDKVEMKKIIEEHLGEE